MKRHQEEAPDEVAQKRLRRPNFPGDDPLSVEVNKLLSTSTVESVLREKPRHVHVLFHNTKIGEAMEELATRGYLSAPVCLNASLEDGEYGTYLGIVDVGSMLRYYIQESKQDHDAAEKAKFWKRLLITITGNADVGVLCSFEMRTTLKRLIDEGFFANKEKVVHRIAVFGERGQIVGLVTQSDVIRFLHRHKDALGTLVEHSMQDLGLGMLEVVTAPAQMCARDAFVLMTEKQVTALALVDGEGKIVGNLSASDVRGVTQETVESLDRPTLEFLETERGSLKSRKLPREALVITPRTTLGEALDMYVRWKVHRLYTVDGEHKPLGVVTLTDILSLFQSP